MTNKSVIMGVAGLSVFACFICISNILAPAWGTDRNGGSTLDSARLQEISNRLEKIQNYIEAKESGNMAFMGQGIEQAEVCVWDNETKRWYTQTLGGKGQKIFESSGNICAYAQVSNKIHFAAWSKITKRWSPLVRHASMIDIVPCDGNFGFFTSNQDAGVWAPDKEGWESKRIPGSYIMSAGADNPENYKNPSDPDAVAP